jgi:hypothetical protein
MVPCTYTHYSHITFPESRICERIQYRHYASFKSNRMWCALRVGFIVGLLQSRQHFIFHTDEYAAVDAALRKSHICPSAQGNATMDRPNAAPPPTVPESALKPQSAPELDNLPVIKLAVIEMSTILVRAVTKKRRCDEPTLMNHRECIPAPMVGIQEHLADCEAIVA